MRAPRHNDGGRGPRRGAVGGRALGKASQGWDPVAAWYDKLVGEKGSDYHQQVILPAVSEMLGNLSGQRVLDLCCGQGVLVPVLLRAGATAVTAVDASERLVRAGRERIGKAAEIEWIVADASARPASWADGGHQVVVCMMAVHDVADLSGLLRNTADALAPGGRAIFVMMHPCFRIPQKSHWGWDADQKIQFRRMDRYRSAGEIGIATHPSSGESPQTSFFHRPLEELFSTLGSSGLALTGCRELYSHRRSQGGGPFSKAEHLAAQEFPLFLAFTACRSA